MRALVDTVLVTLACIVCATAALAEPTLRQREDLCYDFVKRGLKSSWGGLYSTYRETHADDPPDFCGHCSITESESLLARYAALRGDQEALDGVLSLVAPQTGGARFCDTTVQLLHWILNPDGTKRSTGGTLASAEGEENRLMEAFGVGAERFPDRAAAYREFVGFLARGMIGIDQVNGAAEPRLLGSFEGRDGVPANRDDYLMQSCFWTADHQSPTTTDGESNLSYNNLLGFHHVTDLGDPVLAAFYSRVIEHTVAAMKESQTPCGLYRVMYDIRGNFLYPEIPLHNRSLALNRPAVASSVEGSGLEAANAVDGNSSTRWSSQFSDPQWIYVDLGSQTQFDRVRLAWETAYARQYSIQVAPDGADPSQESSWQAVFTETGGDGGVDDIRFASKQSGRYVRMHGTQRGTEWGYSLYELEVFDHRVCSTLTALDLAHRAGRYARLTRDQALWEMARRTYLFYVSKYNLDTPENHEFNSSYDAYTGDPVDDWDAGLAECADLVDLACLFGDYAFAQRVINERILPNQVMNPEDPDYYGAFRDVNADPALHYWADASAFANLEILSALQEYDTPCFDPPLTDRECVEGDTVQFAMTAKDANQHAVTLSATGLPAGASFESEGAAGTLSWTPGTDDGGRTYPMWFSASDGRLIQKEPVYISVYDLLGGISDARSAPDGRLVSLRDAVVSAVFADRFYVEQADRGAGMQVRLMEPGGIVSISEGDRVEVRGVLGTVDGERVIGEACITSVP